MAKFINVTPHEVSIIGGEEGNLVIPTTGLARVATATKKIGEMEGVEIFTESFGEVEGLPAPQDDTYFIVSRPVAAAVPERKDLVVPGSLVRDDKGTVIGCKGLILINA